MKWDPSFEITKNDLARIIQCAAQLQPYYMMMTAAGTDSSDSCPAGLVVVGVHRFTSPE